MQTHATHDSCLIAYDVDMPSTIHLKFDHNSHTQLTNMCRSERASLSLSRSDGLFGAPHLFPLPLNRGADRHGERPRLCENRARTSR